MKFMRKQAAAAVLAGLLVLAAAGCGGDKKADGSKTAAVKDTLKVGVANFAASLEPADNDGARTAVRYGIGETLVRFDRKMDVTPWLAESWKLGDDKLTWTFRISDRAVFSNGNKVTGDAVARSLRRTFEKAPRARAVFECESIKGEGRNVIIQTKRPVPKLPNMLCNPLFLITDTSVRDRDYVKLGPVGTGPYAVKFCSKEKCVLERNERYWDGKVPFKTLELLFTDDPNARALALRKGEADVAVNVAAGDMALFGDADKYRISEIDSVCDAVARLNVKEGRPLADRRVREALASALDRSGYCKVLLKGTFRPGGPLLPPSAGYGYDELMKQDKNQYNPERARKLLKEAGWKDTNGDGFVDKDGNNLELDCIFYSSLGELPLFAEATRADAGKVGIKVNLKNVDYSVTGKTAREGAYDLCLARVLAVPGDAEVFLNMNLKSNNGGRNPQNGGGYSNPEYDGLADTLAVEFDPAKRRALIMEMERIALEDCPLIVYGYPRTNIVSSVGVANADVQPCDYYRITKEWAPVASIH